MTTTNQQNCEECGNPSDHFWGVKQGHKWCNTCYKRHRRTGTLGITSRPLLPRPIVQAVLNPEPKVYPIDTPEQIKSEAVRHIPKHNGYIPQKMGNLTDIEILYRCFNNQKPALLIGEAGTGKNHAVRHLCHKYKIPYARVSLNGASTPEELIGQFIPDEEKGNGAIKWQDGILTKAVRDGGIVVLDEMNAMTPEISFCLHAVTDDERTLTLTQRNGEVIEAHPNFMLIGTMNPDYEGTNILNQAFKDRFRILHYYYNDKVEKQLIKNPMLLEIANMLRVSKSNGEISTPVSTRLLLQHQENEVIFGYKVAYEMFMNKFENSERQAVKNVWEQIESKHKINVQEKPMEQIQ